MNRNLLLIKNQRSHPRDPISIYETVTMKQSRPYDRTRGAYASGIIEAFVRLILCLAALILGTCGYLARNMYWPTYDCGERELTVVIAR